MTNTNRVILFLTKFFKKLHKSRKNRQRRRVSINFVVVEMFELNRGKEI